MAEPAARIEPASSYREPDPRAAQGRMKEKFRLRMRSRPEPPDLSEPDELDDPEKHELDTLA